MCASPRKFYADALLMLNLGCEFCENQNLLIKEQVCMGVSRAGDRERIPPPVEFESDDVINSSPANP